MFFLGSAQSLIAHSHVSADLDVQLWHYGVFTLGVVFILALDLGVFNRSARVISFKEALGWSALWFLVALAFAFYVLPGIYGSTSAEIKQSEFLTGYVLEKSLSMDNVFVIAIIFSYFNVKPEFQHRVLFWGILGALVKVLLGTLMRYF